MTTHKEALEAAYLAGFNASGEGYNGEYPFGDHKQDPTENSGWKKDRDNYIKEALAQPEQEPVAKVCHDLEGHIGWNPKLTQLPDEGTPLYTHPPVLTAQPKEPEQEPVAHIPLKALEQLKPPMLVLNNVPIYGYSAEGAVAVYTTPPQRKPLTDEAAMFAAQHMFLEWNRRQDERLVKVAYEYGVFQKAIELYNEAAHGIKGGA